MSVQARGHQHDQPKVDFQWLSDGWRLFKQEWITWIVATVLAGIIYLGASLFISSIFDNGVHTGNTSSNGGFQIEVHTPFQMVGDLLTTIVYGLLEAGLFRMALLQIRGKRIDPVTFLSVRDVFWPLVGVIALTYIGLSVGFLMCVVPGILMTGLFLFAPLYVVAEGSTPIDAIKSSVNALRTDWFTAILFCILTTLWIVISFFFCGVGEFAAIPQVILATAVGFCRFNGVDLSRAGLDSGSQAQPLSYGYGASFQNAGYLAVPTRPNDARPNGGDVYGYGAAPTSRPPQFGAPVQSMPMIGAPANAPRSPRTGLPEAHRVHPPSGNPGASAPHHDRPSYRIPRPSMRPPREPRRYP